MYLDDSGAHCVLAGEANTYGHGGNMRFTDVGDGPAEADTDQDDANEYRVGAGEGRDQDDRANR